MKPKKILFIALAFVMLCAVVGVIFAEGESVNYTPSSVTVRNTNRRGRINVTVCVTLKDRSGRISDANWYFDNIPPQGSKTQPAPAGNTVVGASSIMCSAPQE
jgi:hypothetical protein